jgi:hypothetical protein
VIPASPLGKIKMVAEVVAILALIPSRTGNGRWRYVVAGWRCGVMAAALISAADYFRRFNVVLSPSRTSPSRGNSDRQTEKPGNVGRVPKDPLLRCAPRRE